MFDHKNTGVSDYLRALLLLLPSGYAWKWGTNSVGRRYLVIVAEELNRLHVLLELIVNYSISRFVSNQRGWSANDYEQLLLDQFGITATVSDGLQPFSCESSCEDNLLDDRIAYVYVITVDDVSTIPNSVYAFLKRYQQSHTHFHFRDRRNALRDVLIADSLHLGEEQPGTLVLSTSRAGVSEADDELINNAIDEDRTYVVGGMNCQSPLYEKPFYQTKRSADWSWTAQELDALSET